MVIERFLRKFFAYEIPVLLSGVTVFTAPAAASQGTAALASGPAAVKTVLIGTLVAFLKAAHDVLNEDVSIKEDQIAQSSKL